MMARHHAKVPATYAGLNNPVPASEESLARGAELYGTHCATCHGDGGMGDGPGGQALDPLPAPIAHTSRMLGDDYLFWRISEGGTHEPFASAMPRWQDVLDDGARWDVINYIRALSSGQVLPGQLMGGAVFDAEAEAAKHDEMAAEGVQQGVITQEEADTFLAVHAEMDTLMAAGMEEQGGGMENMQSIMLAQLLEDGRITRNEADVFSDVHDRLLDAGIME
jgi:mono/diheme cytochrome c family protein